MEHVVYGNRPMWAQMSPRNLPSGLGRGFIWDQVRDDAAQMGPDDKWAHIYGLLSGLSFLGPNGLPNIKWVQIGS